MEKIFRDIFILKTDFKNIPNCNTIFVINYPKIYYESFAILLLPKDLTIAMQDKLLCKLFCDNFLYKPVYRKKKYGKSYKDVKRQIKNRLKENISVAGLVYLTRFSFKATSQTLTVDLPAFNLNKSSSVACVDSITETDLRFCKLTVVLLWVQLFLSFILALLQSME
jgi:hypothetical protein